MATLGIDVGLKTMSMCIIKDNNILLWGVYNTLDAEVIMCETCGRKAKYTDGFCGTHYKGIKVKKNEIKTKKVKSYSLHELCSKVLVLLNKLLVENDKIFETVTSVIVELQPKFNPKMCFVSHVLFTKLCDHYNGKTVKIKFERASNKLKNYGGDKGKFVKNTYKNRKEKAIEYVTNELGKMDDINKEMKEYFAGLKKQDDASDSFLLAFNN